MTGWLVLPYDGSRAARASLRRAARFVEHAARQPTGVIVATAGVDPALLGDIAAEAQAMVGPAVPLDVRLLSPGDPIGALQRLLDAVPTATLAAPLGASGDAPWYIAACRHGGQGRTIIRFDLAPAELRESGDRDPGRLHGVGLAGAVRRAGAWLGRVIRPPPVKG